MHKYSLKLARLLNIWLYKKIRRAQLDAESEVNLDNVGYHSLSPINNASVAPYINALQWALDNAEKKEIYNIALTGPYGSGKSSILKTFKDKNDNEKYVFLNISLATFKEEPEENKGTKKNELDDVVNQQKQEELDSKKSDDRIGKKNSEDVLRLIELSILQQIFYHEEDEKIPDSRFKKIKTFNQKTLYYNTAFLLTALIFGTVLFYPKEVSSVLLVPFGQIFGKLLHWFSLAVFLATSIVFLFRSIRLLHGIRISKFKLHEAEIEIDKNISKSILNNHLDEILYFFEVTPYSVVLIEDLDRFRQAEIFTKLRELNLLINNSKKIRNKKVVFIYAVRDEMFQNKDRTKFFDFIIPVIPVINSSNSKEKLSDINNKEKHGISSEIIDDVSSFIDDMRLLYNITNEFKIYSALLDKGLPRDNLFAMLVYKNIYPEDFVALGNNEGKLYELMQKKVEFVREHINKIDIKLRQNKNQLDKLKFALLKSTDELRTLYVSKFVDTLDNFSHFVFANKTYDIWTASTVEGFEYFRKGNFTYNAYPNNNGWVSLNSYNANFRFDKFENEVDSEQTYDERLQDIEDIFNGVTERIKQDNQALEKQKAEVRHVKLKDVFSDKKNAELIDTQTAQGQLLSVMLRLGYIGEDYLDYISLFYEGSLSKADHTFFVNVKSQNLTAYDTSLVKIANLLKKIRPIEFSEQYLLNYNLLDFMLANDGYDEQLGHILGQLNDDNEYGIAFIDGFMNNGINTAIFIKKLLHQWHTLWKFIDERSDFTKERKEEYFISLIANADVTDLSAAANSSKLNRKIAEQANFLTIIEDAEKLERIIKVLDVKFTDVAFTEAPQSLVDLIVKGTHYTLNDLMFRRVMLTSGNFNLPAYEQSNYSAVMNSNIPELIENVKNKIERYVQNIYLPLIGNVREPEKELCKLLNNKSINLKDRKAIIARSETTITELNTITDNLLDDTILDCKKINVTWNNVIEHFSRHEEINQSLVDFLNTPDIGNLLTDKKIDTSRPHINLETTESFMHHLVSENRLNIESFELVTNAVPYDYDVTEINNIDSEKMRLLIKRTQIAPKPENFTELRNSFPNLQYIFLDVHKADVLADLENYNVDGYDIAYILDSNVYNLTEKLTVLKSVEESVITNSPKALEEIRKLMFRHAPFPITKNLMIAVLNQYSPIDQRIQLFNMYYKAFEGSDAQSIFSNFPAPYNKIGIRHTSFIIDDTTELQYLANNLLETGMIVNQKPDKKGIKIINFKWV